MKLNKTRLARERPSAIYDDDKDITVKQPAMITSFNGVETLEKAAECDAELIDIQTLDTAKTPIFLAEEHASTLERNRDKPLISLEQATLALLDTAPFPIMSQNMPLETLQTTPITPITHVSTLDTIAANSTQILPKIPPTLSTEDIPTLSQIATLRRSTSISRGQALLLIGLLCVVLLQAVQAGYTQFLGPQGWAYILGGPTQGGNSNLLDTINRQITAGGTAIPGATAQLQHHLTPQEYINLIMQHMTLEQKLGQMLIVQFVGSTYSLDLSTMIHQYNVGAVLLFAANNNIVDRVQLKGLIQQMQSDSSIPLTVAIDQEGGTVDRLINLDGLRPSASTLGSTHNPSRALAAGVQDAKDLAFYGINLNLAPVVDVTNVYNAQLAGRTFGNNAALVTIMAEAYIQGLQQSGEVLATLKHFPGLGDVSTDPHNGVPNLYRSKSDLEAIDWSPYRAMIQRGNVYSIMVTHEIVHAIDSTIPSSLSYKVVTGILRNELGFQGVIMTDSLNMEGIAAYYTEAEAAVLAVKAGDDLLMGAANVHDVATIIDGLKQAVNTGDISQQQIDDSVRRILMLKYAMGLLPIPTN